MPQSRGPRTQHEKAPSSPSPKWPQTMIWLNTKKKVLFTKIVKVTTIDNDIYKLSYRLQGGLRPK